VPPTLNLEHPDPACDLDCLPGRRPAKPAAVVSNSFGSGDQRLAGVAARHRPTVDWPRHHSSELTRESQGLRPLVAEFIGPRSSSSSAPAASSPNAASGNALGAVGTALATARHGGDRHDDDSSRGGTSTRRSASRCGCAEIDAPPGPVRPGPAGSAPWWAPLLIRVSSRIPAACGRSERHDPELRDPADRSSASGSTLIPHRAGRKKPLMSSGHHGAEQLGQDVPAQGGAVDLLRRHSETLTAG